MEYSWLDDDPTPREEFDYTFHDLNSESVVQETSALCYAACQEIVGNLVFGIKKDQYSYAHDCYLQLPFFSEDGEALTPRRYLHNVTQVAETAGLTELPSYEELMALLSTQPTARDLEKSPDGLRGQLGRSFGSITLVAQKVEVKPSYVEVCETLKNAGLIIVGSGIHFEIIYGIFANDFSDPSLSDDEVAFIHIYDPMNGRVRVENFANFASGIEETHHYRV
ncbi:hypothetical protein ACIQWN_37175 [Streptomyces vinaceus]|uniref:hypothetical protein n=1 Tax=Streptomyces vinaceus TaxID=1960 RepID=UPI003829BCCD